MNAVCIDAKGVPIGLVDQKYCASPCVRALDSMRCGRNAVLEFIPAGRGQATARPFPGLGRYQRRRWGWRTAGSRQTIEKAGYSWEQSSVAAAQIERFPVTPQTLFGAYSLMVKYP